MTMTMPRTEARHANLGDLVAILNGQAACRLDVVASPTSLRSRDANLVVKGAAGRIDEDGVTPADVVLAPTALAERHLGERLGIPPKYLQAMRAQFVDDPTHPAAEPFVNLYDDNVNAWLDTRRDSLLIRAFHDGNPDHPGMLRAVLSDRYALGLDNLDVLVAALEGVANSGADVTVSGADLTERSMTVKIDAPSIAVAAPALVGNYRSPFTGNTGTDNPMVWAGVVLRNSETGGGAFSLTPRVVFQVCNNGMTMTRDATRQVHVGGRLDEGVVRWSADTERKALDLVKSKASDAMASFLSAEYVQRVVDDLTEAAGVTLDKPVESVERVAKTQGFTETERQRVLSHFIAGGDTSALGVAQAITAAAQDADDGDRAYELEACAFDVAVDLARSA